MESIKNTEMDIYKPVCAERKKVCFIYLLLSVTIRNRLDSFSQQLPVVQLKGCILKLCTVASRLTGTGL